MLEPIGSMAMRVCVVRVSFTFLLLNIALFRAAILSDSNPEFCDSDLHNGDDTPTLSDLYLYKYSGPCGAKKPTIRIIRQIGLDYYQFGCCILNDEDGGWIATIRDFERFHPESIVRHILYLWLQGKGKRPETWDTLLSCLRQADLHRLADDIEVGLGMRKPPHRKQDQEDGYMDTDQKGICIDSTDTSLPDPVLVDKQEFDQVTGLIESLQQLALTIVTKTTVIADSSQRLGEINARLKSGKIRAGVVGITKSGKSTLLNALLGRAFLPRSVQPQTAKEVSIVHDPSVPDGELYGVRTKGEEPVLLAQGRDDIYKRLEQLNDVKRTNAQSLFYDKLILHAPLVFLKEVGNIPLEISDTPGLGEAGGRHVILDSKIAVKDMCAFILMLNVRHLKTNVETELLSDLNQFHQELFSKLKRVLILVNAYDVTYEDTNPESLKPPQIPSYVSNYLREPSVLGKTISPNHILPVSGLWALKSRQWLANISQVVEDKSIQSTYRQGVILLRRAGYKDEFKAVDIREKPEEKTVRTVSQKLLEVSKISVVEEKLTEMLYTHSRAVILESAVDDTLSVIGEIQDELTLFVKQEEVDQKEACQDFWKEISRTYEATRKKYESEFGLLESYVQKAFRAQMGALISSLQDNLDSLINSKLLEGLRGLDEIDDKKVLLTRMANLKVGIPSQVGNKMKSQWEQITDALQRVIVEQARTILTEYRNEISSVLNNNVRNRCNSDSRMQAIFNQILNLLNADTFKVSKLVTSTANLVLKLSYDVKGSEAISDDKLGSHITARIITKFSTKQETKCFGRRYGFFGPRDCIDYTVAVPRDVTIYSTDFGSLQNAFQGVVHSWMLEFQERVSVQLKEMSKQASVRANEQIDSALASPGKELLDVLELSIAALKTSRENIDFLESKRSEITTVKESLKSFLDDDSLL